MPDPQKHYIFACQQQSSSVFIEADRRAVSVRPFPAVASPEIAFHFQ